MMLSEHIRLALSAISAARFRTFLTMFGIIIGVVSVITTVSLGEGIKHQISGQTQNVGNDLITVRPGKLVKRDSTGKINGVNLLAFLSSSTISDQDLKAISEDPNVEAAVPFSIINGLPSIGPKKMEDGFIMATTDKMPAVTGQKVEFGNFFQSGNTERKVAVIGYGVAEKLFEENVPIGKTFQLRGQDFIVGGVFERLPSNPINPEIDFNNGVFIPYGVGKNVSGDDLKIYEIMVRPKDKQPDSVNNTISSLTAKLKQNHADQEDFTVLRQQEMVSVADSVLNIITKSVTVMAAVTLLVGGVAIMNATLVSVTERTREIGIRKAVGATNRQIRTQFLIEAVVISVWGAVLGLFISIIINFLLRIVTNLEPLITLESVVISVLAAIVIGLVFGMLPAVKASSKDPIEALRTY